MTKNKWFLLIIALALFAPAGKGQTANDTPKNKEPEKTTEQSATETQGDEGDRNMVEFGGRTFTGDVYGRPDLPYKPGLGTSHLNQYGDIRNNFLLRRARISQESVFGSPFYFRYQSASSFYRDQSHLASFGEYNKFNLAIRYDETPHIFSNTTFTSYVWQNNNAFRIPLIVRQQLQAVSSTGTAAQINANVPAFVATALAPFENPFVSQLQRRAGSGTVNVYLTPEWTLDGYFWREHESGNRPLGLILNSSPSAAAQALPSGVSGFQSPGTGAELPEPIDYFNNRVRLGTEYGRNRWAFRAGYEGSFFQENIPFFFFDNPFATADIPVTVAAPGKAIAAIPSQGQRSLYPSNSANSVNFAGTFGFGKAFRVNGSVTPGWLRQNDPFVPYTANTAISGLAPLPALSLNGDVQTLAMNWTGLAKIGEHLHLEAKYRHYDYNNNTPVLTLTPIEGDTIGANATNTGQAAPAVTDTNGRSNIGFNRKTLELSGDYSFLKRSSLRLGWTGEWLDRSHRDVEHTFENGFFGSLDLKPHRDLLFRVSGRHMNRTPDAYQDEAASDPVTGAEVPCSDHTTVTFTVIQRCNHRFDEAARLQDRVDTMFQWDTGNASFSASFQTIQNDFNRSGVGSNSSVNLQAPNNPANAIPLTTNPYFLYGMLKDISWIYTVDGSYSFNPQVSLFAEYARENYRTRMISRNRTPTSGAQTILTCTGCDTANNDWESTTRDVFDTYTVGFDFFLKKRIWVSPYYSLSAGTGNVFSRALGNPAISSGTDAFLLTGGSTAENYPETTVRSHDLNAVVKVKITKNLFPKFEYRYQQFDNKDYQTTPMTQYMGCIGTTATPVNPPCPITPAANLLVKIPSQFYPGFVVGDTAAARFLFLGADQPSLRAHIFTFTLEYHFGGGTDGNTK